jgi:uncharacterized membrane protein YhaH (DUF805 family)
MNWYLHVLKNYANFSGRARRQEYWMFFLINLIISLVLTFIEIKMHIFGVSLLYNLAVLIPSLAVAVRRLHDTDRSGWWLLIGLVPLVGAIVLLIFFIIDGTPGNNRFGVSPK